MSSSRLRSMSSPSTSTPDNSPEEECAAVRKIMDQAESAPLVAGDTWYCVSMDWWNQWKNYVSYDTVDDDVVKNAMGALSLTDPAGSKEQESTSSSSSLSPAMRSPSYTGWPGRIKNQTLIGESPHELVKNITLNTDYLLVPEEVWTMLHANYGGGPELARNVVAKGESRQLTIELYPSKFQVVRADVDGNPISYDENDASDESGGDYQCLYFNSNATSADVLASTCEAFGSYRIESRLWVSQTLDSENWRLIGKSETISDLCDGGVTACLMLETKGKETQTFPRDRAVVKSTWREDMKVGDFLDARDHAEEIWYESKVVERNGSTVKLHFLGWESKFDEKFDIAKEPARLMPLNTKVKFWRDFRVNDDIEMRRWTNMADRTGGYNWQLIRIDTLNREEKTMSVILKKIRVVPSTLSLLIRKRYVGFIVMWTSGKERKRMLGVETQLVNQRYKHDHLCICVFVVVVYDLSFLTLFIFFFLLYFNKTRLE